MTENWHLSSKQILTRWASDVDPKSPLPHYPRPQLRREKWLNLNGLWEYIITSAKMEAPPTTFNGHILVPYPIESVLSGVGHSISKKEKIWYRRLFKIPPEWIEGSVLLHFGAVDWQTDIWINKKHIGGHKGGYSPFSFDITPFLEPNIKNEIIVSVWDPSDKGRQQRGKQSFHPKHFILYTPVSGIWQTVWLEPVSEVYIEKLRFTPHIHQQQVELKVYTNHPQENQEFQMIISENSDTELTFRDLTDRGHRINIPSPHLWSPDDPFLYSVKIDLIHNNEVRDSVYSYFGMRSIEIQRDSSNIPRIFLNGKHLFQYGLLDQGYWPDGLYTAPTDDALLYDIQMAKKMGFNMLRKHVKVEPARWYYHCDREGMLVWQDIPNGGSLLLGALQGLLFRSKLKLPSGRWSKSNKRQFYTETEEIIDSLYHFPSIITWVPFNEGWGQFETAQVVTKIRSLDSSRLIDEASGWSDRRTGDVRDIHAYPGPKCPPIESNRVAVNGEFGGLALKIPGHTWLGRKLTGYRKYETKPEFFEQYRTLINKLPPMLEKGLSAAIYTQISDVEGEINGIMTYDRQISKIEPDKLYKLHQSLYKQF